MLATPEMRSVSSMGSLLTVLMTESSEEDLTTAADSDYACPESEFTSHGDNSNDSDDHID